eukprot:TRINITY_DN2300_c0_g1_i1.p1 TRINITY_DN2300_c0_g1~~TRINITY_DN2300_c0_g1_i1.p1  ORF type:complete len:499 (-),score=101.13 TRINITY_DN2300_c0_g1_i1:85-1539(-)
MSMEHYTTRYQLAQTLATPDIDDNPRRLFRKRSMSLPYIQRPDFQVGPDYEASEEEIYEWFGTYDHGTFKKYQDFFIDIKGSELYQFSYRQLAKLMKNKAKALSLWNILHPKGLQEKKKAKKSSLKPTRGHLATSGSFDSKSNMETLNSVNYLSATPIYTDDVSSDSELVIIPMYKADLTGIDISDVEPELPSLKQNGVKLSDSYRIFESVVNLRDVGGFCVTHGKKRFRVKTGMIYRSGTPATGSPRDIAILIRGLGIRTMIDLRSKKDYLKGEKKSAFRTYVPKSVIHSTPFLGLEFVVRGVVGPAPARDKVKSFQKLVMLKGTTAAKSALLCHVNAKGLFGMYTMFLDHCKAQICKILEIFTVETNYPIHYFCNAGKDRTGVISALMLSILLVDKDSIIDDYHLSENEGVKKGAQRDAMESNLQKSGLSEDFMNAPKEAMAQTLWYLTKKYGSVNGYLDHIGFSDAKKQMVRDILLVPDNE